MILAAKGSKEHGFCVLEMYPWMHCNTAEKQKGKQPFTEEVKCVGQPGFKTS